MKVEWKRIFKSLDQAWPDAHCELVHHNHFQLLLAVMLSAQTTDKSVNKALAPILMENPKFSPHDLLHMGESDFLKSIKSIGLAPTKAKNAIKSAQILVEKFQGHVPLNRQDLESLPGVGRKTANVVLNVLCQLPTMPVDTHVERVSIRLGLVSPTKNRLKIELELLKKIPKEFAHHAHHLLIFHGRYHCMARNPKCNTCPVEHLCPKIGLNEGNIT